MSSLTGKCDFYDWIFSNDRVPTLESFMNFKEKSGSKFKMIVSYPLNSRNFNIEKDKNPFLKQIDDKHFKYFNQTYSMNKLKKGIDYHRAVEIHFEKPSDLIGYLGHIVAAASNSKTSCDVTLSEFSYNYARLLENLSCGFEYEATRILKQYNFANIAAELLILDREYDELINTHDIEDNLTL